MRSHLAALLPCVLLGAGCATVPPAPAGPVEVAIVAINDFHGNLEPPGRSVTAPDGKGGEVEVPAGGAAYLASAIDAIRARHANSVVVSAGDMVGASPIASALFLDEPTVHAMNAIGLEFNALGNHEFDRGREELLRLQNGGCEKYTLRTPCALEPYTGARFRQLAANTLTEGAATLLPGTAIKTFGKGADAVRVGFVGLTTRATGTLVSPSMIAGLSFADEAATINAAVPALRAAGADAVVVLIHEGGSTEVGYNDKSCTGLSGAIVPIINGLTVDVDAVVSGHTHRAYVCALRAGARQTPLLLTSAGVGGSMVTEMILTIDPATNRVLASRAENRIVQGEAYTSPRGPVALTDAYSVLPKRSDIDALVTRYVTAAREVAERPVGRLSAAVDKATNGAAPRLVADAQLAATRGVGAQIAFMNPFGVRAGLVPDEQGRVSFGQIFAMQPFGNSLVTMTLTGAQIAQLLEQGAGNPDNVQWLAPSDGFTYRYDLTRPQGARITAMVLNGQPLDPRAAYRVTVNSFLASGGDGFSVLRDGRDRVIGMTDLDAMEAWLALGADVRPAPLDPRVSGTGD